MRAVCESQQWRQSTVAAKGDNSWGDVQRRTPGWREGRVVRICGIGECRACNEDSRISERNTRMSTIKWRKISLLKVSAFKTQALKVCLKQRIFTPIQVATTLSRTEHRFTHEVAPAGSVSPAPREHLSRKVRKDFSGLSSIISIS